mgnify:FL=1
MSWKSIAGNQTVSRENLQNAVDTGVFVQRAPIPSGYATKQITKAETDSYISTWELYPSYRNKASNQLPVKSDLAVQSNQLYGTQNISLGNNNRNWNFNILEPGGDSFGSIASSTDNRCILAGKTYEPGSGGKGAYVSNNYGESFTYLSSIITSNDACLGAAMNTYGDYMILTRQVGAYGSQRAYIYWSYNSGVNWATGYHDSVDYNFNGAAMSGIGTYATVIGSDGSNYYVFRSTSFGSSFTKTYLCNGIKVVRGGCVAMSKSGQYQLLTPPQASYPDVGKCFLSTDWGETWTSFYVTIPPVIAYDEFYGCSVSAGGDYMTISCYSSATGTNTTFASNDWGASWHASNGANISQAVDSSGQFQYQSTRASIDYGYTWDYGFSATSISVNQTTFTKPYMYGVSYYDTIVESTNQGESFSVLPSTPSGNFVNYVCTSGGSNNGKYVGIIKDFLDGTYQLYTSSDYGASWVTHFGSSGEEMKICAVSDDGNYWLAATYNPSNYTFYINRSIDGGVSWSYTYYSLIGTPIDCAISNDGKYMTILYQANGGGSHDYIVNSSDYGATWQNPNAPSGRIYNSIAMSGYGRWRTLVVSDNGLTGCRIFYSGDYGVNWSEKAYISGYYGICATTDNTGKVAMVAVAKADGSSCKIYHTKNGWNEQYIPSYDTFHAPLQVSIISGLNMSSDATYWTGVSANTNTSFTTVDGGSSWTIHSIDQSIVTLTK